MNGAATWSRASRRKAGQLARRPDRASARSAKGSSTSDASAVRANTTIAGETSSSATLMNR